MKRETDPSYPLIDHCSDNLQVNALCSNMSNIICAQITDLLDQFMHIINAYAVRTVNVKYLISHIFLSLRAYSHMWVNN